MKQTSRRATVQHEIRNQPAYTTADAARYLKIPPATLRSWFTARRYETSRGAKHWERLIAPASDEPLLLSFWNLIEAHVLWALRVDYRVPVAAVRKAVRYAERELGVERLLLRKELCTDQRALFLRQYGDLVDLSASGQMAIEQVLDAHLRRVEWDEWSFPVRLHPFLATAAADDARLVAIDPAVAFGRPVVQARGITTSVLADRLDAGESVEEIAEDYELTVEQVERAILYERTA